MENENIFITWHYTTHGIAYLKHILSAFYKRVVTVDTINADNVSQKEMNAVFDKKTNGFLFNKVYYLTAPQNVFDNISARRFNYKDQILRRDDEVKNSDTVKVWERIRELNYDNIKQEINTINQEFTEDKFELWKNQIWRDIQHYKISDQIKWFRKYSNAHANYKSSDFFIEKELNVKNLRDTIDIADKLNSFIQKLKIKHPNANFIINATLGSNETQVVWQVFSELNILPNNTKLIRSYDNKANNPGKRFKDFHIKKIPSKIISEITNKIKLYGEKPKSTRRQLAEQKMQQYINAGFAIFILGERGIGKTKLAEKYKSNKNIISVNCASFTNSTIAESILFGYKKGAFTDAKEDRKGVFEEANNGILFLDEIHHLSMEVQAKLMKATQTDDKNRFTITRLGDSKERKITTILIFASNQSVTKLHKKLLPDFYDRITQLVIELPPLRDTIEDIPDAFENVWAQMKFDQFYPFRLTVKNDNKLLVWLKKLPLSGNYRDLQKIAIYYKTFLDFNDKIKSLIKQRTPFEFTKSEFEKYISYNPELDDKYDLFSKKMTVKEMESRFKKRLAEWAIDKFSNAPNAEKHFKKLGDKTTKETLYRWRNTHD
ncbi:MAG: sigma 54-interacting transcriptional regulator [Bacteroidota bacterium]|nr:sigma 54-interacting transcriptional regulator [Bacteroidota bacterium]